MFDENFQGIPYLGVLSIIGDTTFIVYFPLLFHAYLETSPIFKAILDQNPNTPILSMLKDHIKRGVDDKQHLMEFKAEIEVYIGIYLVVVWFVGWSNLLVIILYW
jgi:hypothetical protein